MIRKRLQIHNLQLEKIFQNGYISRMANDPRTAESIPSERIGFVAAELERFAVALRLCESVAKTQEENSLAIYYWTSAESGLKRLASFVRAAEESRRSAELGKPLVSGQLKPRSTAKKHKSVAEAQAIVDKNRSAKKKKSK